MNTELVTCPMCKREVQFSAMFIFPHKTEHCRECEENLQGIHRVWWQIATRLRLAKVWNYIDEIHLNVNSDPGVSVELRGPERLVAKMRTEFGQSAEERGICNRKTQNHTWWFTDDAWPGFTFEVTLFVSDK